MNALVFALLLVVVAAGAARAIRPGSIADRVIGVDVALLGLLGIAALRAVTTDRGWLLDVVPVVGLLAILGTLAAAHGLRGAR